MLDSPLQHAPLQRPVGAPPRSVAALLTLALVAGCAAPDRRFSIVEENDLFASGAGKDRDYSQGLRFAWEAAEGGALEGLGAVPLEPLRALDPIRGEPRTGAEDRRSVQLFLEQRIFNPINLDAFGFVPDERPYAGLLFLGALGRHVRLDADGRRRRDVRSEITVAVGATGDWSLGEIAQRGAHYVLGEADAAGWDNQIDEEILAQIEWDARQRTVYGIVGPLEYDLVAGGRAELGTAFTNLQGGFELRSGQGLPRDARPWSIEGDAQSTLDWFLSAGANLKWVAHDITLDGSLWNDDPELFLNREDLVYQWWFGLTGVWNGFTLGYRFLRQTKEYDEEIGYHSWGTISLGYRYQF